LQDATTEKRQRRVETEKETEIDTPDGVSESVFKDFLEVRKTKKAKWTDTALKGLTREAEKAGMSLQQAMEICCSRGWVGFNADWVKDAKPVDKMKSFWQEIDAYGSNPKIGTK
jgi:hypothetical protein